MIELKKLFEVPIEIEFPALSLFQFDRLDPEKPFYPVLLEEVPLDPVSVEFLVFEAAVKFELIPYVSFWHLFLQCGGTFLQIFEDFKFLANSILGILAGPLPLDILFSLLVLELVQLQLELLLKFDVQWLGDLLPPLFNNFLHSGVYVVELRSGFNFEFAKHQGFSFELLSAAVFYEVRLVSVFLLVAGVELGPYSFVQIQIVEPLALIFGGGVVAVGDDERQGVEWQGFNLAGDQSVDNVVHLTAGIQVNLPLEVVPEELLVDQPKLHGLGRPGLEPENIESIAEPVADDGIELEVQNVDALYLLGSEGLVVMGEIVVELQDVALQEVCELER